MTSRRRPAAAITLAVVASVGLNACAPAAPSRPDTGYPWHTGIVATTFWVGEIFDPDAPDGSQRVSTYDSDWLAAYGGCDGVDTGDTCRTETRTAETDFFPSRMTPRQNPFYLDLPFDDVNDPRGSPAAAKSCPGLRTPPSRHPSTTPRSA